MIKTFKHRIRQLSAFICMTVVAMLALNDIVFLHAHELPNGQVIVHAHPYSNGADSVPQKKHHHSTTEYITIDHVLLLFPCSFFTLAAVYFCHRFIRGCPVQRQVTPVYLQRFSGRSPPMRLSLPMILFLPDK